jgi:hypothetical protein
MIPEVVALKVVNTVDNKSDLGSFLLISLSKKVYKLKLPTKMVI